MSLGCCVRAVALAAVGLLACSEDKAVRYDAAGYQFCERRDDCQQGQLCVERRCRVLCIDSRDCLVGKERCRQGVCLPAASLECLEDTDCPRPTGAYAECRVASCRAGTCVESSLASLVCEPARCVSGVLEATRTCGPDGDCPSAGVGTCQGRRCNPNGTDCLPSCVGDGDCMPGYACQPDGTCCLASVCAGEPCGAVICDPGETCASGACRCGTSGLDCPATETCCPSSGLCIDRTTDPNHCGRCGNACGVNSTCAAGQCLCAAGFLDCNARGADGCEASVSTGRGCGSWVASGGAGLASEHYKLELFVAPMSPIGDTSSPGYRLRLGPAATRTVR